MSEQWRGAERFPIAVRVMLRPLGPDKKPNGEAVPALGLDISEGGMRFQFRRYSGFNKDGAVALELEEAGGTLSQPVVLKVAWVHRTADKEAAESMGAFFVGITEADRKVLLRMSQSAARPSARATTASSPRLMIAVGLLAALSLGSLGLQASLSSDLAALQAKVDEQQATLDRLSGEVGGAASKAKLDEKFNLVEGIIKGMMGRLARLEDGPPRR